MLLRLTEKWRRPRDEPLVSLLRQALDDPKVQRLAPHNFRVWVNLLCISSKDGGMLPSAADIAFKLRMSELDAKTSVEDLIMAVSSTSTQMA